ncbi:hypothetical protein K3495_g6304 [Podosphaera aphanis]|nr:hypothetical protein K3495_g6304 [Podosphaera aphanis]
MAENVSEASVQVASLEANKDKKISSNISHANSDKPQADKGTNNGDNSCEGRRRNENKGRTANNRDGGGREFKSGRRGFGSKNPDGRKKKGEMGRGEWSRGNLDKRKRNDDGQAAKRRKTEEAGQDLDGVSQNLLEKIEPEERRPKRKVAVMIGYAGTGYKGMQINAEEKTIEGDIFKAFVAAGAISKANADDPKKSSLVRCARTDKGVHAAGNVISLKLIVEDSDIVQKINANLPPQIRVWGYERTNGGFSCYQSCDSRWYEYLIPTYSFLPPHPQSFLGKKLVELAEKEGYLDTYLKLQEDACSFWDNAMEIYVKPILEKLDPITRETVMSTVHKEVNDTNVKKDAEVTCEKPEISSKQDLIDELQNKQLPVTTILELGSEKLIEETIGPEDNKENLSSAEDERPEQSKPELTPLEAAVREVKAAYITAKKLYRLSTVRQARVQEALNNYLGTRNFHNYTIQKNFRDPSAKRVIKSFDVAPSPIIINDTEWLSMKVHGQSFMMHQIRKMVGMAALVVRCGTPMTRIMESYGPEKISIPKAPGLGLLLERPVFSSYNQRAITELGRAKIDFDNYKTEIDDFKQREIYDRIFREEERDNLFHSFFHHVDHHKSDFFLWVSAAGTSASKTRLGKGEVKQLREESDDEVDGNGEEG